MADGKHPRAKKAGIVTASIAAGIGASVAAAIAAQRAFAKRERTRPDPYRHVPYGTLRGRPIGPIASSDGTLINAEEAGAGPVTLIFSHGFSLNLTIWHHQIEDLSKESRVVLHDHRGHGRSGRPPSDDWSLDALARDLDAVIRDATRPDEPVILVGHSMGGMAVMNYCRLFPEMVGPRVRGLILADTASTDVMEGVLAAGGRRMQAVVQALQAAAMRLLAGNADRIDVLRRQNANLAYLGTRLMGFGHDPSPTQVNFMEQILSEVPSDVWLSLIPTLLQLDVHEALHAIDVPTLVVVGDKDRLTPMHAAQRIADAIRGAHLAIIEGAGHTPMLEKPDVFNEQVRRFIARIADEPARAR